MRDWASLRMLAAQPDLPASEDEQWDTPFATRDNMERFYQHLEQALTDIEFLDPAAPRQLIVSVPYMGLQLDWRLYFNAHTWRSKFSFKKLNFFKQAKTS